MKYKPKNVFVTTNNKRIQRVIIIKESKKPNWTAEVLQSGWLRATAPTFIHIPQ